MKEPGLASIEGVALRAVIAAGVPSPPGPKPLTKLQAWLELRRERREIAAMGPGGRLELHAVLLAGGGDGLSSRVWPAAQRAADILACDAGDHLRAIAVAHSAAMLRSASR